MGCQASREVIPQQCSGKASSTISKTSKKIVQDMWQQLRPDLKNFGITIFVRLFEEQPNAQELFYNFKDLQNKDELLQSLAELDHVARVMSAFGSSIQLLDNIDHFSEFTQALGKAHIKIGINESHLNTFGTIVLDLLSEHSQSTWSIKHEKAWKEFFVLLVENICIGLRNNNKESS